MKRILILIFIGLLSHARGQINFTNGHHSLELKGMVSGQYTHRFLNPDNPNFRLGNNPNNALDHKKNVFELNTARIQFEGRIGKMYEYELQFDLARIGFTSNIGEFPAIVDGYFKYIGWNIMDITVGYQKLPYSRSSLTSFTYQPFWQRGEVARGRVFSRRDAGVTLSKSFWQQRANVYFGAYSGQGEYILTSVTGGDNDPMGTPELVGRFDIAYPSRYRYNDVYDHKNSPQLMVALGLNGRYVQRMRSLTGIADYDLKIIAGTKSVLGLDFAAQYKGFSALIELHQMQISPTGADTVRLQGKDTNFFRAGGTIAQLAYFNKDFKSGLAIRYDDFIPNDLILNNQEKTVSFAFNYMIDGFRSMLRLQYWHRLDPNNNLLLRTSDQVRIGWQLQF